MKHIVLGTLALLAADPAMAVDCPQQHAVYTEKANGYTLSFRPPESWEAPSNTSAILELAFPDGTTLWGTIWLPNGTSWDRARLYDGCVLPGMEDDEPGSSGEELDACRIWNGVIYGLAGDDVDYLPYREDAAAPTILLPDLGPTIRYSGLVMSPGDEPHDVFTLTGCTP